MDSRLLTGALDMLILDVLGRGDSYGHQISRSVMGRSDGYFELKEGSLYPALHRLERQGILKSYWIRTGEGRRRKYYHLTAKGRNALEEKQQSWTDFTAAVNGVLGSKRALA